MLGACTWQSVHQAIKLSSGNRRLAAFWEAVLEECARLKGGATIDRMAACLTDSPGAPQELGATEADCGTELWRFAPDS
eukprot:COSAG04_NODE_20551_length_391_cov_0.804795_1_plen_78_part_10